MSATQEIQPQTQTDDNPANSLLTNEERAALALELTGEDGEPAAPPENEEGAPDAPKDAPASDAATAKDAALATAQVATAEAKAEVKAGDANPAPAPATAPAQAAPPEAPAPIKPAQAADHAAPTQQPGVQSHFSYSLPADYNARVAALEGKFLDLDKQLADGVIEQAEYNVQFRQLAGEQGQLQAQASRAEIAREMREQEQMRVAEQEGQGWSQAVQTLIDETKGKAGTPDYGGNEVMAKALGKQVEALMVERGLDPALPVSGKLELVRQAHRVLVFLQTGKAPEATAPAATVDAKAAVATAQAARTPDLSGAAKSIAAIPAGDNGSDKGEFAELDKLKGEKLEAALAEMARRDPAAYERYLNV